MYSKRIHKVAALWLFVVLGISACSSGPAGTALLSPTAEQNNSTDPVSTSSQMPDATDTPVTDENSSSPLTPEQLHSAPSEMAMTWESAMVRIPDGQGGIIATSTESLESGAIVPDTTYPVVIWMHGCNGFWSGTSYRLEWLARNGFVAIAPLSLARSFYPTSCNVQTFESGLYRPTLLMRQYDAGYAIEQVRKFPWADKKNLILAGLSEGAAVATTYFNQTDPAGILKARIAESWTCHAGWGEFEGINAPASEGVLSLLADNDPWYTAPFHQGDCGEFMSFNNGSLSFVADYAPVRFLHELWEQPEIQEIILNFLLQQLQRE